MGTDKVVFVEDPEDLTIARAQPEVTSPEESLTGSDRVRMRGLLLIFFTFEPQCYLGYFLYWYFTGVFASIFYNC